MALPFASMSSSLVEIPDSQEVPAVEDSNQNQRRSGAQQNRRVSSVVSDGEIARLLQLEEQEIASTSATTSEPSSSSRQPREPRAERILGNTFRQSPMDRTLAAAIAAGGAIAAAAVAAGQTTSSEASEDLPPGNWLYNVEICSRITRCHGCHGIISRGQLQVMYRRDIHRRAHAAHPVCLPLVNNLSRPPQVAAGSEDAPVRFGLGVDSSDRAEVQAQLSELPLRDPSPLASIRSGESQLFNLLATLEGTESAPNLVQPRINVDSLPRRARWRGMESAPNLVAPSSAQPRDDVDSLPRRARGRGRRGSLQRRLLQTDRDFTAEDYEVLLQLDEEEEAPRRRARERPEVSSIVDLLPTAKVSASAAGATCMVCLDAMEEGAEVRTLPCMHVFHRSCIDRWLAVPGRVPKCPIDQTKVEVPSAL